MMWLDKQGVDAANCYDRVAHHTVSLLFKHLVCQKKAVHLMLTAIEEMKYYLRTAHGDSKSFIGHEIYVRFQGLCQRNGAAPAGWAVVSIAVLGAHKKKAHGGHWVCPISRRIGHLAEIMFGDDNDLIHIDMGKDQTADEAQFHLQNSVTSW